MIAADIIRKQSAILKIEYGTEKAYLSNSPKTDFFKTHPQVAPMGTVGAR